MAHWIMKTGYVPVIFGKKPCIRLRDWKAERDPPRVYKIPDTAFSYTVIQR